MRAVVSAIRERLESERRRFLTPPVWTARVACYAAAAAAASLIWITPHILNPRHVVDPYDPVFSAWRLARFAHQLMNDPARLFDGNIFYPTRYTLTYSDPTVLQSIAGLPFIAAGADPLLVANGLFLLSFPLCAFASFYAAWRLTADPQAACVAGVLGGAAMFKIAHYSHLELQFLCFAPVAVVMLLRMLAAPSSGAGAALGACVAGQWLACMYLGIMLVVFLVPVGLVAAIAWRPRVTRRLLAAATAAAIIAVSGFSVTGIPFVRSHAERGERPSTMVAEFSARPRNYLDRSPFHATYTSVAARASNRPEHELFPGLLPSTLGAVGAAAPMPVVVAGLLAGMAVAFDGSFGPNGVVFPRLQTLLPFRSMRSPARFGAFVGMGLILLSAFGAARILALPRRRRTRALVFVLLMAAALVDTRMWLPLQPFHADVPSIYTNVDREMVLAEVPMRDADISYMYFSTGHWAHLINGYSGYIPAHYEALVEEMKRFPAPDLLIRLRALGATHLTLNCHYVEPAGRCSEMIETLGGMHGAELLASGVWEGAPVRLYALRE